MINRAKLIQMIIDNNKFNHYLEIGVDWGNTFFQVNAKYKTAVDPIMKIGKWTKRAMIKRNYWNIFNRYYPLESDDYFSGKESALYKSPIQVVLIDGLHTFSQSLKDTENCLKYLNKDGYIILHDCNPQSYASSFPANSPVEVEAMNLKGWDGSWNGDVWKTILYLRSQHPELNVCVINCDHGLGIVRKDEPDSMLDFSFDEINTFDYYDLDKNRIKWLNLKEYNSNIFI